MQRADILGVQFDPVTLAQATQLACEDIASHRRGYVVTPNPEIVTLCRKDAAFRDIVNAARLVLPDGIGIVYAAKILGLGLRERVPGIEFAQALMEGMAQTQGRLFLLGAKPGVAEKAARNLTAAYPGLQIVGTQDGYFSSDEQAVQAVNACGGADVVFVCLGMGRQERFIVQNMDKIDATLFCGLGGSLDVFSGESKRAPKIFIKLGLEWFYRLLRQPSRIGRMMQLPFFLLLVLRERIFGKQ